MSNRYPSEFDYMDILIPIIPMALMGFFWGWWLAVGLTLLFIYDEYRWNIVGFFERLYYKVFRKKEDSEKEK